MDLVEEDDETLSRDDSKCISEMVKAVLVLDHSKKPFKPSDIQGFLSRKPNRKSWNRYLDEVKKSLNNIGLKLVETQNASSKSFFLVSKMFPLRIMHELASEEEIADRTLLILILTFIFMKEGCVSNVDLFNHLHLLNIYHENHPIHNYFGDVKKKILTDFVSQLYLEKVIDKESEVFEIKWGERAHAEVSKKSILEFVCKIGYEDSIKPTNLVSHYRKALKEEEETRGCENDGNNIDNDDEMVVD